MKQAWVNKKEKLRKEKIASLENEINEALKSLGSYSEDELREFTDRMHESLDMGFTSATFMIPDSAYKRFRRELETDHSTLLMENTLRVMKELPYTDLLCATRENYCRYLDSEPKHFHGDIIITDPCYVIKDEDWSDFWDTYDDPDNSMIPGMICRDTIYGDWSCTVFDTKTKQPLGKFCADSGMVAVFDLAEALRYNPAFDNHISNPHSAALIKNFDGDVWFEVKHSTFRYNSEIHDDYSVRVRGKGDEFVARSPIDFTTSQTGL